MECPNCGTENSAGEKYCQKCASPLDQVKRESGDSTRTERLGFVVSVIAISAIVIIAGLTSVLYIVPPRTIVITHDIELAYGYLPPVWPPVQGLPGDGNIQISGYIHNHGNTAAICELNYSITDSRGWSLNDSFQELRVNARSDYLFSKEYVWPGTFDGISLIVGNVTYWTITPHFTMFNLTADRA